MFITEMRPHWLQQRAASFGWVIRSYVLGKHVDLVPGMCRGTSEKSTSVVSVSKPHVFQDLCDVPAFREAGSRGWGWFCSSLWTRLSGLGMYSIVPGTHSSCDELHQSSGPQLVSCRRRAPHPFPPTPQRQRYLVPEVSCPNHPITLHQGAAHDAPRRYHLPHFAYSNPLVETLDSHLSLAESRCRQTSYRDQPPYRES